MGNLLVRSHLLHFCPRCNSANACVFIVTHGSQRCGLCRSQLPDIAAQIWHLLLHSTLASFHVCPDVATNACVSLYIVLWPQMWRWTLQRRTTLHTSWTRCVYLSSLSWYELSIWTGLSSVSPLLPSSLLTPSSLYIHRCVRVRVRGYVRMCALLSYLFSLSHLFVVYHTCMSLYSMTSITYWEERCSIAVAYLSEHNLHFGTRIWCVLTVPLLVLSIVSCHVVSCGGLCMAVALSISPFSLVWEVPWQARGGVQVPSLAGCR